MTIEEVKAIDNKYCEILEIIKSYFAKGIVKEADVMAVHFHRSNMLNHLGYKLTAAGELCKLPPTEVNFNYWVDDIERQIVYSKWYGENSYMFDIKRYSFEDITELSNRLRAKGYHVEKDNEGDLIIEW